MASDEVPVGCVFVYEGSVIGEGINDTNRSLNVSKVHGISFVSYSSEYLIHERGQGMQS